MSDVLNPELLDPTDVSDLEGWYQDPAAVAALERALDEQFGALPVGHLDFGGAR